jgi:hypothetical protein
MSPTLRAVFLLLVAGASTAPAHATDESAIALADFLARRQETQRLAGSALRAMPLPARAGETDPNKSCGDRDFDGLSDCVETGTGVYRGLHDTGTSRDLADTDGDALRDGDEVLGTPYLNLPALGVSPLRKDILLEYDWIDDALECGAHSHRPTAGVAARVAQAFAAAPVDNPDGSRGINVVQDFGQGGALSGGQWLNGAPAVLPGTFDATFADIKRKYFSTKRGGYFHYVLLAHRYANGSNSSGYAEIVGDDLIVTLYCFANNDTFVANTIVHELGHNLGLHHGGFEACNGKPNYSSLMNYRYQFAGIDQQCTGNGGGGNAGLSSGNRLPLDERAADERVGVCGSPAIDWNGNGVLEPSVSHDLNSSYNAECGSPLRVLDDFDDWSNLEFAGVLDGAGVGDFRSVQTEVACAGAPPSAAGAR